MKPAAPPPTHTHTFFYFFSILLSALFCLSLLSQSAKHFPFSLPASFIHRLLPPRISLKIHSDTSLFTSPDWQWRSPLSRSLCLLACPPPASTHPTPTSVLSWWTFSPRSPGWQTVSSAPATTSNFRRNSAPLPRKVGGFLISNANESRNSDPEKNTRLK